MMGTGERGVVHTTLKYLKKIADRDCVRASLMMLVVTLFDNTNFKKEANHA